MGNHIINFLKEMTEVISTLEQLWDRYGELIRQQTMALEELQFDFAADLGEQIAELQHYIDKATKKYQSIEETVQSVFGSKVVLNEVLKHNGFGSYDILNRRLEEIGEKINDCLVTNQQNITNITERIRKKQIDIKEVHRSQNVLHAYYSVTETENGRFIDNNA